MIDYIYRLMIILIKVLLLIFSFSVFASLNSSFAVTYYVDFNAGNDANNGLTINTAWKRSPGDANATGIATATILKAGDTVKFKGGVVYLGTTAISSSGISGSPITFDGNNAGGSAPRQLP